MSRVFEFNELDTSGLKESSLKQYTSILNIINNHFKWEKNKLHYDKLNDNLDDVLNFILEHYKITNTAKYKERVSVISSLMKRCPVDNSENQYYVLISNPNKYLMIPDTSKKNSDVPDWETEVLPKLQELSTENSNRGFIALIFSYEYVFRLGEMFKTRLDKDDREHNYLDLETGIWIFNSKSTKSKKREVTICNELLDVLVDRCKDRTWLICRSNGTPYESQSSHRLSSTSVNWNLPFDNVTMRKSVETYNLNNPGRSYAEKQQQCHAIGHTMDTAINYYLKTEPEPEREPEPELDQSSYSIYDDDRIPLDNPECEPMAQREPPSEHDEIKRLNIIISSLTSYIQVLEQKLNNQS